MMFKGYRIAGRVVAMIVGGILLVALILLAVHQCGVRRSRASQTRLERSQAQAASNSAAEAIGTVAKRGEAEAASEELTRQNERDIRNAEGANQPVNPAVRNAGIAALCKRPSYANDPRCRRP